MGWRGALRSMAAAARQAERERVREARAAERAGREQARISALERASDAVERYEELIDSLLGFHKECSDEWNWKELISEPEPIKPDESHTHEIKAARARNGYMPTFWDKLLRRAERRFQEFSGAVSEARRLDEADTKAMLKQYQDDLDEWTAKRALAALVLEGNVEAYCQVVEEFSPLPALAYLGRGVRFSIEDPLLAEVTLYANPPETVPQEMAVLLKSGKVSLKNRGLKKTLDLYQEHVCAALFRCARETLALLPVRRVLAHGSVEMVDRSTGHLAETTVLSVDMPRETVARLNYGLLDCSDALKNFVHRMDFRTTEGFRPVEKLRPGLKASASAS